MKKIIGNVTEQERDDILKIFERRNGLKELAKILTSDNDELYERLVKDLGETSKVFDSWWDVMASKYKWEGSDNAHWEINFETCDIYLVNND